MKRQPPEPPNGPGIPARKGGEDVNQSGALSGITVCHPRSADSAACPMTIPNLVIGRVVTTCAPTCRSFLLMDGIRHTPGWDRMRAGCAQHRGMASNVKHQPVKGDDGKIVTNLPGVPDVGVSMARVAALDLTDGANTAPDDDDEGYDETETCRGCSADLADDEGEGYDGFCGSCADNVQQLLDVGVGERTANTWVESGYDAELAFRWRASGVTVAEAVRWNDAGVSDPMEAHRWRTAGWESADEIKAVTGWRSAGFTPENAARFQTPAMTYDDAILSWGRLEDPA
jgi:hypothetical protein